MKDGSRLFSDKGAMGGDHSGRLFFEYVPDQPVLKKISVHSERRSEMAIDGPTGVGKSTLVSLVPLL